MEESLEERIIKVWNQITRKKKKVTLYYRRGYRAWERSFPNISASLKGDAKIAYTLGREDAEEAEYRWLSEEEWRNR